MEYKFKNCILGTGPTARICSRYISSHDHLVIGNHSIYGSLTKKTIKNQEFNLTPIFPVYNSELFTELWGKDKVKSNFLQSENFGDVNSEYTLLYNKLSNAKKRSYAKKCLKKDNSIQTKKNLILAYKLFGNIIFERELSRLYSKVSRHYLNNIPNLRIGFENYLSPYYEKVSEIDIENFLFEEIEKIDLEKKKIFTTNSEISYQHLISTINLKEFLFKSESKLCIDLISMPATFFLLRVDTELLIDKVIYDIEIDSPIYRVFTISSNTLIVQLSCLREKPDLNSISIRLTQILNRTVDITWSHFYKLEDAYPIDSTNDNELIQYMQKLQSQNIDFIGRLAQWEYLDLHELKYPQL